MVPTGSSYPKALHFIQRGFWHRGWCELLCGRGCGFCMGPLKRYQEAFSAGRYIPTLQVSNYMNREAIVQVALSPACHCLCVEVFMTVMTGELSLAHASSSWRIQPVNPIYNV